MLFSMVLGLFAAIFSFIGMECTYIGGKKRTKDRILVIGCAFHFIAGIKCPACISFLNIAVYIFNEFCIFLYEGTACLAAYGLFTVRLGRAPFAPVQNTIMLR